MKNTYTPESASQLARGFDESLAQAREALFDIMRLGSTLKSQRAREYLHNGVGRRLRIIQRCVVKIYEICPLDRSDLSKDELEDLNIYLHAFLLNVYGILDDLAVGRGAGNNTGRGQAAAEYPLLGGRWKSIFHRDG